MMQVYNIVAAQAKEMGVKNFAKMWESYKRVQRGSGYNLDVEQAATNFPDQPMELRCGRYTCDAGGVACEDKGGYHTLVCSHPLMPVKRMENIDTGEQKVEIAFSRGGVWRCNVVDRTVLSSANKIVDLSRYGMDITTESARDVVKYLATIDALNYDKIGEVRSVGRLGWVGHELFSPYVPDLRYDGDAGYAATYKAVHPQGSLTGWLEAARHGRESSIYTRVMLAASFASVLVEPCDALPFFVHAWGGSGNAKTVSLMLAASVWADPTAGAYYKTFNATGVGQEMTAGFLNSLPLCLDELQVIKDKKDFDQTIYTLCEGVGRARGAKAGGLQRMQTWRNAIITTGEMPITNADSGGGAVNRVINMDCQDEKLFADPRWAVSMMRRNYGHAGRAFVEHLTGGAMDRAKELQKEYYAKLTEQDSTEKQALSASLLLAADTIATELLFQDDLALTVDDLAPMLVTRAEADVNARCYEWLTGFIAVNSNRFDESADNKGEVWGKLENDTCYFVATKFEQIMREYGYSSSSFLSWCSRVGKIRRQDNKHYKSLLRIRKTPTRVLQLLLPPEGFVEVDDEDEMPWEQTKVTM
nr:MAG TPA: active helicase ring shaped helicase [Bacteriophage sp.]